MTPAEKLAAKKPWRREPRNKATYKRKVAWKNCKVREVRESLRLSLRDVAKAINLSQTALWQIEKGHDCMLTTSRKLAAFFGKTTDELWQQEAASNGVAN